MARNVNSMDQLANALLPCVKDMVKEMTNRVYETLNFFLQEYYDSYDPKSYRRLGDYLRSAIKVEPKIQGNKVTASVYIDYNSMDNYYNASGLQVATWANEGLHGGLYTGSNTPHVWDDTMENTVKNGELINMAMSYLRSHGFQ